MRISDWSSDVCSSDLETWCRFQKAPAETRPSSKRNQGSHEPDHHHQPHICNATRPCDPHANQFLIWVYSAIAPPEGEMGVKSLMLSTSEARICGNPANIRGHFEIGRASCRERVGRYV